MRASALLLLPLLAACTPAGQAPAVADPSPVHAGIDRATIDAFLEAAAEQASTAVLVHRGGEQVAAAGAVDELHDIQSITKSVSALAIGTLLAAGRLESLDVPMHRFVPTWRDGPRSAITVRHVLLQASGLEERPLDGDPVAAVAAAPLLHQPGLHYRYDNVTVNLLAEVVAQTAGVPLDTWVAQTLFAPLGIFDWRWKQDRTGRPFVTAGLHLAARDLAKIGALVANDGVQAGERLLPADFLAALRTPGPGSGRYGLLWWLDADALYAHGWQGQWLYVLPAEGLVVVRLRRPADMASREENERHGFARLPQLARALAPTAAAVR